MLSCMTISLLQAGISFVDFACSSGVESDVPNSNLTAYSVSDHKAARLHSSYPNICRTRP